MSPAIVARRLAMIGLGLIGSSLGRALRQSGAVERCVGFDVDVRQQRDALALGAIDAVAASAGDAVAAADLVVMAVPVLEMGEAAAAIRAALSPAAVLTDVGSTKCSVMAAVRPILGESFRRFVPAHPIAGTEKSGAAASQADLFRDQRVVLTPSDRTDSDAVARVGALWRAAGARVETMNPQHHDEVFAATSHLPHVLAYVLVDLLDRLETRKELFRFAAGGFRDFTRIASSSPKMWHDVVRANRSAVLTAVDQYADALRRLRDAIDDDDSSCILETFSRARQARERYLQSLEPGAGG